MESAPQNSATTSLCSLLSSQHPLRAATVGKCAGLVHRVARVLRKNPWSETKNPIEILLEWCEIDGEIDGDIVI